MKTFSPPKRQTTADYEEAEKDLEESGNQAYPPGFRLEDLRNPIL
jgi:hypothetical protein